MRKSSKEEEQPSGDGQNHPEAHADEELVLVSAPDPDYDPGIDDELQESGQRRTIDLDADLDLEAAMKAVDRSLRKKKTAEDQPAGNGVAASHVVEAAEPAPAGAAAGDEVTALRAQLEQERNNTLRAVADLHNYRRRAEEDRTRIVR